ncbi:MAG: hypothetical protein PHE09_06960 [Oscillospiraceae bacterium]|nr:hypothetical protein [Oscillospiraceae bacterium]
MTTTATYNNLNRSGMIYDSALGSYVKKLNPDMSIPVLKKIPGSPWVPIFTVPGREAMLLDGIKDNVSSYYYPRSRQIGSASDKNIPLIPGIVFVALAPAQQNVVKNNLWVKNIYIPESNAQEERFFADTSFVAMIERISRFFRFSYEKNIEYSRNGILQEMPMSIDGYGECLFISYKNENNLLLFKLENIKKCIKFELTVCQFRSLLLSKVL